MGGPTKTALFLTSMNTQKPQRSTDPTPDALLDIHSIFYTIQGEGPFAGQPAVFVRLAGCNLQCPGCDTAYTNEAPNLLFPEDIGRAILNAAGWSDLPPQTPHGRTRLVVITGGEPFRQGNLVKLVEYLIRRHGLAIQIETNGTIPVPEGLPIEVSIVCSPKTSSPHYSLILNGAYFKFVVSEGNTDANGLPTNVLGRAVDFRTLHDALRARVSQRPIYLQPIDVGDTEANKRHADNAARLCMQHGYRLTLQLHKFLDLP